MNPISSIQIIALLFLFGQQSPFLTKTSAYFAIKYDRNLLPARISEIADRLDSEYVDCMNRYGITSAGKINVMILTSPERFRTYAKPRGFDDGMVREGTIYLCAPVLTSREEESENVLRRVVARSMLNDRKGIPPWFSEAFALYAGNELTRFGDPARLEIGSFEDLSEEFNRAQNVRDVREAYAKLTVAIDFLVKRFGEKNVCAVLSRFKPGYRFDEIAGQVFGEPFESIEQAWIKVIRSGKRE